MSRCEHEDKLLEMLYGELPDDRRAALEGHLAECDACRDALVELRGARDALAAWRAEEPGECVPTFLRETEPVPEPTPARHRLLRIGVWAPLAAAAMALLIAGTWWIARRPAPAPQQSRIAHTEADAPKPDGSRGLERTGQTPKPATAKTNVSKGREGVARAVRRPAAPELTNAGETGAGGAAVDLGADASPDRRDGPAVAAVPHVRLGLPVDAAGELRALIYAPDEKPPAAGLGAPAAETPRGGVKSPGVLAGRQDYPPKYDSGMVTRHRLIHLVNRTDRPARVIVRPDPPAEATFWAEHPWERTDEGQIEIPVQLAPGAEEWFLTRWSAPAGVMD